MPVQKYLSSDNDKTQTLVDPVCGMAINEENISYSYKDKSYYFCQHNCLTKFKGNEEHYLSKQSQANKQTVSNIELTYFCPMHPEVVRTAHGDCPICGMSLESQEGDSQAELANYKHRLFIAILLSLPVVAIHLTEMLVGKNLHVHNALLHWIELLFTAPVVFYAGSIFFQRAYNSIINRSPNMFTLIALGVGTAFGYSIFATIAPFALPKAFLDQNGIPYVYFEAAAVITTLTLFGQLLESYSRSKTNNSIQSLFSLAPKTARLITSDGSEKDVTVEQITIGDIIRVRAGESLPADGVILQGNGLLDESIITGESLPVEKTVGDKVIGATINNTGSFTMRVEEVGATSLLGQIVKACQQAQLTKAPIQQLVDSVANYFVPIVIIIALLTFIIWASTGNYAFALLNSIAVLIIACPCALGLATPMSITVAIGRGAHSGILIKEAKSLQLLHSINTVVVDKTGTLTEGKPQIGSIITCGAVNQMELLRLAASIEIQSEHPLASAIISAASKQGLSLQPCKDFWTKAGKGIGGTVDNHSIIIGNAQLLDELSVPAKSLSSDAQQLSEQGHSLLFIAVDKQAAGLISVVDPIRSTTTKAIADLQNQNIQVVMLTGDNKTTASAVAKQIGITEIYSAVLPTDKASVIKQLQNSGKHIAMAGDGINDAPALTQADVGIAMGTGTDIAMNQAEIVLVKGDLLGIVKALNLSNATMNNIRWNLLLAFGYNIIAIPIAAGILYPMFGLLLNPMIASLAMSLSSVSVIANSLRLSKIQLERS